MNLRMAVVLPLGNEVHEFSNNFKKIHFNFCFLRRVLSYRANTYHKGDPIKHQLLN